MVIETTKLVVLFLLVFTVMRLLGKTLLSQWTAYDLVTIIFLSYAALGAVKINSFFHAVICIISIGTLYVIISRLSLFQALTNIIIGEPTILIKHGTIIQKNLKKIRYSLAELLSMIRTFGYPDIKDIEYAILEPNGKISVIPIKELQPLTVQHCQINVEYTGLPLSLIIEGKIQKGNLTIINKDEAWLEKHIVEKGFKDIKEIYYAYIKDNEDSFTILNYQ
ncbi:DUF421 domain-containing protein [Anaerobacillus alkaliphilus]|uniref:DUF421 domain-containing protein n=1 Tax=Anaerobacillus alkaliphilus TaxID=1548597 RepID=A0A4Q0VYS1_9BACI|nr:DUF421 domain-containing protein [Anaerobacillus alkaliphilus]RXJ04600.1 DUF421 domain-containing protein [Anaerobacillus alkaliphilus]